MRSYRSRRRASCETGLLSTRRSRRAPTSSNAAPICAAAKSFFGRAARIRRRRSACSRRSASPRCRFIAGRSSRSSRAATSSSIPMRTSLGSDPRFERYAVAASLRAMGAAARALSDVARRGAAFESALAAALAECDAVVVTGGSSVGERDRLPHAVATIADPGIVVHGLRVKPGKPTLFGADGGKPIIGLPGNPTSALLVLEAVAAPIIAALTGAPVVAPALQARLAAPARSRADWTWYVPVRCRMMAECPRASTPLALVFGEFDGARRRLSS